MGVIFFKFSGVTIRFVTVAWFCLIGGPLAHARRPSELMGVVSQLVPMQISSFKVRA